MNSSLSLYSPFEQSGVRIPGMPILPLGVERHPIEGGTLKVIAVFEGDEITIVDCEGLQPVELLFFGKDGSEGVSKLGLNGGKKAMGIISMLTSKAFNQTQLNHLKQVCTDLQKADAEIVFEQGSIAGQSETFIAHSDGMMVICAVGQTMSPHEQNTLTDITAYIKRVTPLIKDKSLLAPEPLADPVTDINIQPGMALAYEVKKGQFIQVLDVKGRECSDFQAFSLKALDKGIEREIDPTTTRTLMGSLYPSPGIFSKYWNVDQEPLVEIVQDSCGRHDTFGLACTAKYYDDLGYPGHINCSENINRELASYDISPRKGWAAINFFYNTLLDSQYAIGMDDPWSRPGDYVLLRALTDLVCVSTACPCDIDPANGWDPTDIQVRTYQAKNVFKTSIGWRKTPGGDMQDTQQTGFHSCFAEHTRDFIEYNGYWLANSYTHYGAIKEYWAAREKAVIMDLSALRKYEITGPDAEALLQYCMTRNIKKLPKGGVVYTAMCYEHGGMIDDGTVFRLDENNFRWIGGCNSSGEWLKKQVKALKLNAWVRESTQQQCNIAVQGPLSRDILKRIIWTAPQQATLEELGWFRFSIARIGDYDGVPIVVSRTGYTGELGYEIFCHPKDAKAVFDAVWKVGQPMGMIPLGLAALDMLRIESGLIFAGYEFSDQTNPFEAGISFTVPLKSKEDDFIGKAALQTYKAHPHKTLVGLRVEAGVVPSSGDCVHIGKAQIGEITSALKSPILGKVIALARVYITHAEIGTQVEVGQLDGHQKRLKAEIVRFPHFDPTKERAKGNY